MDAEEALDLSLIDFTFIFGVHSLEKFRNLEIAFATLHTNDSSMELLNLPLNFLFDLYLALKQLRQGAHDVITTFLDIMQTFFLDFLQKSRCHFFI